MRRSQIFWRFLGYFASTGLVCGAITGTLYGLLLAGGEGALVGAVLGGPLGLGAGAVDGIILALVTIGFFHPLRPLAGGFYRGLMHALGSLLAALLAAAGLGAGFFNFLDNNELLLVIILFPAAIAALAVNVATFWSTRWYLRRSIS